jgi:hypothetical protein
LLDDFEFTKSMKNNHIDVPALPLARQAAVLQAMQFAPFGLKWKVVLSKGDFTVRSPRRHLDRRHGKVLCGLLQRSPAGLRMINAGVACERGARADADDGRSSAGAERVGVGKWPG